MDLKCFRKADFIYFRVNFACFTVDESSSLWNISRENFFQVFILLLLHVKRVDGPLFWSCSGTHTARFSVKARFFRRTERKTQKVSFSCFDFSFPPRDVQPIFMVQ